MKSLSQYIKESQSERLEPTKENILKLIKKAYNASVNDPENKKYGYLIDIRGVKGSESYSKTHSNVNNEKEISATSPEEFEELAQELADHYKEYGDDAYFNAENFWNDNKEKRAESDDKGVELRNGEVFTYGC